MGFTARILAKDIVSVRPNDTIADAARRMADAKVGAVVVVEGLERLVGILTERDIAYRVVAKGLDAASTHVSEAMTPQLETLQADDPLDRVFKALNQDAHRHLPILDGSEIIGMVSLHDFAMLLEKMAKDDALVRKFAEAALSSPRQTFKLKKKSG